MSNHKQFMQRAIDLAYENVIQNNSGPFGAIIVKNNEIIAEGVNLVTVTNDPTAHAEIVAIRNACKKLNSFQLIDCVMYSSCEPCPMCLGAIFWARPQKVYFAATAQDAAKINFDDAFIYEQLNRKHEERAIPFIKLDVQEHLKPFNAWQEFENKIVY
ncbi:MAG: nucleoside deaminase [Candidatus Dependentiae bacterium]